MVRYRQGHAAETRAAIVAAASGIMRNKGFAEASVGAVMKAVGLTHGGFYAHFADKTAMLNEAMREAFVQSPINFAALSGMARASGDAGLVAKHYLADRRVVDVASGCPAAALVSEVHRQEPALQATFREGAEATVAALATTPGLADGEVDHSWASLAMLVGALALMRAMPDPELNETIRTQCVSAMRRLAEQPAV